MDNINIKIKGTAIVRFGFYFELGVMLAQAGLLTFAKLIDNANKKLDEQNKEAGAENVNKS